MDVRLVRTGGVLPSLPPLPPPPLAQPGHGRPDGRDRFALRPVHVKIEQHGSASGSCYYVQGNTRLSCSIWGPRPLVGSRIASEASVSGDLVVNVSICPFACPNDYETGRIGLHSTVGAIGIPSRLDNERHEYVRLPHDILQALEGIVVTDSFPNSEVLIAITVVENDGCVLAAAINTAFLALASAGIPMRDLPTAVTLGVLIPKSFSAPSAASKKDVHTSTTGGVAASAQPSAAAAVSKARAKLLAKKSAAAKLKNTADVRSPNEQTATSSLREKIQIIVDPTTEEMAVASAPEGTIVSKSQFHMALCPVERSLAFLSASGVSLDPLTISQLLQVGEAAANKLNGALRETLKAQFEFH